MEGFFNLKGEEVGSFYKTVTQIGDMCMDNCGVRDMVSHSEIELD